MNLRPLLAGLVLSIILVSGCIDGQKAATRYVCQDGSVVSSAGSCPKPATTTPTTSVKKVVSTLALVAPTTTLKTSEDSMLAACSSKSDLNSRDACYLALAIEAGRVDACNLIERDITKSLCMESTQIETDGKSTTIEGYVVDKTTSLVIPNVTVRAVSKTLGEKASAKTNSKGFYSMKVPSRDNYEIVVESRGGVVKEEVYAKKGFTHEIWFRI